MSGLATVLLVLALLVQGAVSSEEFRNNNGHLKNASCCPSQSESDEIFWHIILSKKDRHNLNTFGKSHQMESRLDSTLGSRELSTNCSGRYTWSLQKHFNSTTSCECGSRLGHKIACNSTSHEVSLLRCYCLTYGEHTDELVVGSCFYSCIQVGHGSHDINARYPLPIKPSQLNQLCKKYNRDGQLCGKCQEGFAPPVYSYSLSCVNCTEYTKNWVKYIAISFLPLTGFFILVVTFRVSVTSGTVNTFVLISQTMTTPAIMRVLTLIPLKSQSSMYILLSVYGIWNLDFFRLLYSPFCLHPKMTTVQALALDYAIATYPLVLIAVTYLLVEMHDYNFRIFVWLWKPFHRCFTCFRRVWDIKASLIDAFATFILLSYVKFLSVSFDLLVPVHIFNVSGDSLSKRYLFYDGTMEYFGKEHLPYGILALVVLLVFNLLPLLLLCLYPCKCFQRCLNRCRLQCQALHIFMDALQGHYKDGTHGTRDCRWFAALYLIFRILFLVIFVAYASVFFWLYFAIPMILVVLFLTAVFQPYKSTFYNNTDTFLLLEFIFLLVSLIATETKHYQTYNFGRSSNRMLILSLFIPLVYLLGILLYKLLKICHKRYACNTCRKIKYIVLHSWRDRAQPGLEELFPDRMIHAEEYTPLIIEPVSDYKLDHPSTEQSDGQETSTY